MRHGIAEPADSFVDDASRPLTRQGTERSYEVARGLKLLVPRFDALVSSPKIRAIETAKQVRRAYRRKPATVLQWPELASDDYRALRLKLRELNARTVCLIGHEPHLSAFATLVLAQKSFEMTWKKAGACALEVDETIGTATLLWFLPPQVLRKLVP